MSEIIKTRKKIFLGEYLIWLDKNGINADDLKEYATDNEKGILCNAFIREKRKGWKITKREKEIINDNR